MAVGSALAILAQAAPPAAFDGAARYAEVGDCIRGVATEFKAEGFDKIRDRAVERCGPMIPFPVAPIIHRGSAEAEPSPAEPDRKQAIRRHITFRLREIMKADAPRSDAPQ